MIVKKHLQYNTLIGGEEVRDAVEWCVDNFGARWDSISTRDGLWTYFWNGPGENSDKYSFRFAREQDLCLFLLRWS